MRTNQHLDLSEKTGERFGIHRCMAQTTSALRKMCSLGTTPKRLSPRLPGDRICDRICGRGGGVGVGFRPRRTRSVTRAMPVDLPSLETSLRQLSGTLPPLSEMSRHVISALGTLADADMAADVAQTVTAAAASDAAVETATKAAGPFSFIADSLETILKVIDSGLEAVHVPYAYGFAIIILTVMVKIVTFPLSKKQVESSIAMQSLQPQVKEIQEKHKNNPQMVQQLTSQLYQSAGVNPLAGCLPTLATIPVFIGLYRALLNAADEGVLTDGFFVIPSLAGPTTISARQAGMGLSWLFPFKDGAPPIGWHDAAAYLVLPTLLVVSQYVSQSVLQPTKNMDPSQAGAQNFLKVLPLLLGWFSLNVPSGLALYWITNNVLTTGQQAYLKRGAPTPAQGTVQAPTPMAPTMKPTASSPTMNDVIDTVAEESKPTGAEMGARRSRKQREDQREDGTQTQQPRSRKGERFRARKAREAAKKAKSQKGRLRSGKKQRKDFIPEPPNDDVAAEFEKELSASPLLPIGEEGKKEEVETVTAEFEPEQPASPLLPIEEEGKKAEVEEIAAKFEPEQPASPLVPVGEEGKKEEVETPGSNNRA